MDVQKLSLLIVDDEPEILDLLVSLYTSAGYERIYTACSVRSAIEVFEPNKIDMVILDIMLPDGSGFDVIRHIRTKSNIPVLFLSALSDNENQYVGFDLGADDYIVKPFRTKDLLLRTRAILQRSFPEKDKLTLGNIQIDFSRALVKRDGSELALTAKEFAILDYLYKNKNRIVSIDQILEAVWGPQYFAYNNSLMAHIRKIRQKIEEHPSKPRYLLTYKGLGYTLKVDE